MCRADVADAAAPALAALLVDLARRLAELEQVDPRSVRIGPVDFGPEPEPPPHRS